MDSERPESYREGVEKSFHAFFQSVMEATGSDMIVKPESSRGNQNEGREPQAISPQLEDHQRTQSSVTTAVNLEVNQRANSLTLLESLQHDLRAVVQQHIRSNDPMSTSSRSRNNDNKKQCLMRGQSNASSAQSSSKGKERLLPREIIDLVSDDEIEVKTETEVSTAPDTVCSDFESFQIHSPSGGTLSADGADSMVSNLAGGSAEPDDYQLTDSSSTVSLGDFSFKHSPVRCNLKAYKDKLKSIGKEKGSAHRHAALIMARILSRVDISAVTPVAEDEERAKVLLEGPDPPPVIVLNGQVSDVTISGFLDDLETFHSSVSVQDSAHTGNKGRQGKSINTSKLRHMFQAHRVPLSQYEGKTQSFQQPLNCLGISNPDPTQYTIQPPACLSSPRWKLLQILCRRLSNLEDGPVIDMHDPFILLSQEDAITLPHQDRHGTMTYLRVIQGSKLWIYWDLNKKERFRFRQSGLTFSEGKPRVVALQAGQTLIMRPGTVHAVITTDDALCFGGQIWDAMGLTNILQHICDEVDDRGLTTNEGPAVGLYEILQEAQRLTRAQRTKKPPPLCYLKASHRLFDEALTKVREFCYDGDWQSRRKQRKRKEV